jgi:hypothetical protein
MARRRPGFEARRIGRFALAAVVAAAVAGCSRGEPVTADSLAAARQTWGRAGIRDYQLEWKATGASPAHYLVTVRDGAVARITSRTPDGSWIEVHPAEPRFYGVDGLFTTIADELAQLKTGHPFGQPADATVVMRASFDPKLGYPISYHRDVLGVERGLAIDVIRLIPTNGPVGPNGKPKA